MKGIVTLLVIHRNVACYSSLHAVLFYESIVPG